MPLFFAPKPKENACYAGYFEATWASLQLQAAATEQRRHIFCFYLFICLFVSLRHKTFLLNVSVEFRCRMETRYKYNCRQNVMEWAAIATFSSEPHTNLSLHEYLFHCTFSLYLNIAGTASRYTVVCAAAFTLINNFAHLHNHRLQCKITDFSYTF